MESNEIKALKLIEALECGKPRSQRDLADRLGISLGLVNALLKRLAKKGYFRIRTVPKGKAKYVLTPKGMAEKSVLTYRYILYSLSFYKDIQNKFRPIFSNLKNEGKDRLVLFGKGELSEIASILIEENHLQLVDVIDDVTQLQNLNYDTILILELENLEATERSLLASGIPSPKIMCL